MNPRRSQSRRSSRFTPMDVKGESTRDAASESCTKDDLEGSLLMLSEELEALGFETVTANKEELSSLEFVTDMCAKLIDTSWALVRENRSLSSKYDQLADTHCRIANDNTNLKNRVERKKEELEKERTAVHLGLERERRMRVELQSTSRELKHEKEETLKLRKQMRSKENQHEHELRRAAQNGRKLREQLAKTLESNVSKEKSKPGVADKPSTHKQTIARLEEENRFLSQEVHELRESLALHTEGIALQIEASGNWTEPET